MHGDHLQAIAKKTLETSITQSTLCWNHIDYIDKNYSKIAQKKSDIMVGFGFVSFKYGLSDGVPIDIYNMLLAAENIRREVLDQGAKVHVLIGDHLAYQCPHTSCEKREDVTKKRHKYIKKIMNILKNLQVEKYYELHLSTEIVEDPYYKEIRQDLEKRAKFIATFQPDNTEHPKYMVSPDSKYCVSIDTWNILNCIHPYNSSNRNYFLDQTAICRWLYDKSNCGVKVSWSKVPQTAKINQSKSFDEPHFDRFYRELYFEENQKLSFIYTKPGYATNRNDEWAKVIPYTAQVIPSTAPKEEEVHRILLSSKKELPQDNQVVNQHFVNCVAMNVQMIKQVVPEVVYESNASTLNKDVHLLINFSRKPDKLADLFKKKLTLNDNNNSSVQPSLSLSDPGQGKKSV